MLDFLLGALLIIAYSSTQWKNINMQTGPEEWIAEGKCQMNRKHKWDHAFWHPRLISQYEIKWNSHWLSYNKCCPDLHGPNTIRLRIFYHGLFFVISCLSCVKQILWEEWMVTSSKSIPWILINRNTETTELRTWTDKIQQENQKKTD